MSKIKEDMYEKTQEDFKQDLTEQIYFLRKSARDYDNGDYIEAKNMSVRLRNLLHDTNGPTTSVLTHLGKKDIKFYDTSIKDVPGNLLPLEGLIHYKVEVDPVKPTKVTYDAVLDNGAPPHYVRGKVDFNSWWKRKIVDDRKNNTLTRKELVLTTCQQDGGAHVDSEIIKNYVEALRTFNIVPISTNGEGIILSNIIYGSIRQITYEVLKSLEDEFPDCFKG